MFSKSYEKKQLEHKKENFNFNRFDSYLKYNVEDFNKRMKYNLCSMSDKTREVSKLYLKAGDGSVEYEMLGSDVNGNRTIHRDFVRAEYLFEKKDSPKITDGSKDILKECKLVIPKILKIISDNGHKYNINNVQCTEWEDGNIYIKALDGAIEYEILGYDNHHKKIIHRDTISAKELFDPQSGITIDSKDQDDQLIQKCQPVLEKILKIISKRKHTHKIHEWALGPERKQNEFVTIKWDDEEGLCFYSNSFRKCALISTALHCTGGIGSGNPYYKLCLISESDKREEGTIYIKALDGAIEYEVVGSDDKGNPTIHRSIIREDQLFQNKEKITISSMEEDKQLLAKCNRVLNNKIIWILMDRKHDIRNSCSVTHIFTKLEWKPEDYKLELMSHLPNNNKQQAEAGKIYLAADGAFVVRTPNGYVETGFSQEKTSFGKLYQSLADPALKNRIISKLADIGRVEMVEINRDMANYVVKALLKYDIIPKQEAEQFLEQSLAILDSEQSIEEKPYRLR